MEVGAFGGILIILGIGILYFLPCVVCAFREPKAGWAIFIINLFLGWTFIGWVVALAWAASGEKLPPRARARA